MKARKILLIDDQEFDRALLRTLLSRVPEYQVVEASGAEEGVRVLEGDRFDLVLLDIEMPGKSGEWVLEQIRSNPATCHLPVVIVSCHGADNTIGSYLNKGANDFVTKPLRFDLALSRIQNQIRIAESESLRRKCATLDAVRSMVVTYRHEINNPLSIAKGALEKLSENRQDDAAFEMLIRSVDRIESVVKAIDELPASDEELTYDAYSKDSKIVRLRKS